MSDRHVDQTDDIVARLRAGCGHSRVYEDMMEAATEIERLRAVLETLQKLQKNAVD
jgi:hypothetical protein